MNKKKTDEAYRNWNSEIRIRHVKPELKQKLEALRKQLKKSFESQVVEFLVDNYASDQMLIRQLSKRNSDLHQRLQAYVSHTREQVSLMKGWMAAMDKWNVQVRRDGKQWIKEFGTISKPGKKGSARTGANRVPKKGDVK